MPGIGYPPVAFTLHVTPDYVTRWTTVDQWQPEMVVSRELVTSPDIDRAVFAPDEDGVTFTVDNGSARYRWTGFTESGDFCAVQESAEWSPPNLTGCAWCPHVRQGTRRGSYDLD